MEIQKAKALLAGFFANGKELRFKAKEPIIHIGELSKNAYRIKSGTVKVVSYTESGSEQILHIYKAGEVFPISAVFNSIYENTGFYAFTDAAVQAKPFNEMLDFLEKEPYSLISIFRQQSFVYGELLNVSIVPAERRVICRLLHFAERFGVENSGHIIIKLPMTIQEFAQTVRLSRETAGKILRGLEDNGAIVMSRQRIIVYEDKLRSLLEPDNK
jgi:CRP-like cAMP-binding protein